MELWKLSTLVGLSVFAVVAFGLVFIRRVTKWSSESEYAGPVGGAVEGARVERPLTLTIRAEATIRVGDLVVIRRDPATQKIYARPLRDESVDIERLMDRPATDTERTVVAKPPPAFRPPPLRVPMGPSDITVGMRGLAEGERVRIVEENGTRKVVPAVDGGEKKVVRVREEDGRPVRWVCVRCKAFQWEGRCPDDQLCTGCKAQDGRLHARVPKSSGVEARVGGEEWIDRDDTYKCSCCGVQLRTAGKPGRCLCGGGFVRC